jgi:Tol biopolymer transport system component
VSTRVTSRANIWILDLATKKFRNLTGHPGIQGDPMKPNGFFRTAWSPDGKWIAFSSDRNTEWKGHGNGSGWEHVQELSVYIIRPDGTGLRKITEPGISSGTPSPDISRYPQFGGKAEWEDFFHRGKWVIVPRVVIAGPNQRQQ